MSTFYPYGATLASLAFVLYTAAIYFEFKKRVVTSKVLILLLSALALNIAAVVFMSMYSMRNRCTFHSVLGYISLFVICFNSIMTIRFYVKNGPYTKIPFKTRIYTSLAYVLWLIAYFTGGFLGLVR